MDEKQLGTKKYEKWWFLAEIWLSAKPSLRDLNQEWFKVKTAWKRHILKTNKSSRLKGARKHEKSVICDFNW